MIISDLQMKTHDEIMDQSNSENLVFESLLNGKSYKTVLQIIPSEFTPLKARKTQMLGHFILENYKK